jgi:hypothetical protein
MSNLILEWTQLLVKSFFSIHSVFVAQGDLDLKLVFLNGPHFFFLPNKSNPKYKVRVSNYYEPYYENPTIKTLNLGFWKDGGFWDPTHSPTLQF